MIGVSNSQRISFENIQRQRTRSHVALQAAQLDRLASYWHEAGDVDKAAHCIWERSLIVASSAGAARYRGAK